MEEYLTKMKKEYRKVKPTLYLQQNGWVETYQNMDDGGVLTSWSWIARLSFATIIVLVPIGGTLGLIKAANAAAPETTFYPIKLAIEVIVEKVTGSNQLALEHRVEEIAYLAGEEGNSVVLKEVVGEYVRSVSEEIKEVEEGGNEEEKQILQKKLNGHKQEFDEVVKENPSAKEEVEEAIKATGSNKNDENSGNNEGNGNNPEIRGKSEEAQGNNKSEENKGKKVEEGRKK